ncbi:hypothetical protein B0H11DRAFT_2262044 [Mycena galericulata]|nr:hypothetical protein B0H11DRAFT_2262044 [Mycena galericulata]
MTRDPFGDETYAHSLIIHNLQTDPVYIARGRAEYRAGKLLGPKVCMWCRISGDNTPLFRCSEQNCMDDLPACGPCTLIAHQQHPRHDVEEWTEKRYWKRRILTEIGYVYQRGHDGLACPCPSAAVEEQLVLTRSGTHTILCRDCECEGNEEAARTAKQLVI